MNRGYVKLWRKSLDAGWIKNPKLWAFWSYCLMKASHKEFDAIIGLQVVHLLPGQFVFGRKQASKETGLTEREIRTIIDFLIKAGNMTIKTTNKYSVITIINWPIYQSEVIENDQLDDQQVTSKRPHTRTKEHKNKRTPADFSQIQSLEEKYSDSNLIDQCFNSISSTRKSNRISDSVKLNILQQWNKYPADQVMAGIRIYLDKDYAAQGKDERYLLGIIRGNSEQKAPANIPGGMVMKRTNSMLDKYHEKDGFTLI